MFISVKDTKIHDKRIQLILGNKSNNPPPSEQLQLVLENYGSIITYKKLDVQWLCTGYIMWYEIWFRQTFPLEGNQQDSSTDCFAVN